MDETLVKKAKKGDEEAFRTLIADLGDSLYRIAFLYVKEKQAALDLVSETVFKGYTSLHTLKKDEYFQTWMTRILLNCCKNFVKKQQRVVLYATRSDGSSPLDDIPAKPAVFVEERLDLYNAIDSLGESNLKSVIILKYFRDLTLPEIARIMGVPEGTAKSYLHRALTALRTMMEERAI
ncbi:RNA polymerase sigma factor SigV [compost metagenome]